MMKTIIRQIGGILLVSGMLAAVANIVHPHRIPWVQDWSRYTETRAKQEGIRMMPLHTARETFRQGEAVFIDARPSAAFAEGHIPGAVSIPFQSLDLHFETLGRLLDSGRALVLYCGSRECDDALLLAIELQAMGADKLMLYVDGFELWEKHGGPVEGRALSRPNVGKDKDDTAVVPPTGDAAP